MRNYQHAYLLRKLTQLGAGRQKPQGATIGLSQVTGTRTMQPFIASFSQKKSKISFEIVETLYQQLETISNTTISLQYDSQKFLTFKVYEASKGTLLRQGHDNDTIQCQIRGTTYKFTREHLDQMSNRERHELLKHLGIQDK